jgi:hypothetical protein
VLGGAGLGLLRTEVVVARRIGLMGTGRMNYCVSVFPFRRVVAWSGPWVGYLYVHVCSGGYLARVSCFGRLALALTYLPTYLIL